MLFSPIKVGALTLDNRMVMAPLTRTRAGYEHLPNALMAEYYAQRASAGLIITECTMITPNTSAFAAEPGVYSAEQIEAWKLTTNAVHAKGGKIFMQIWHAGRAAHPDLNGGAPTFSASAIAINGDIHTQNGMVPHVAPQELSVEQIQVIVQEFAQAAKNAIAAGFDGVEVHAANGYLIDQFLRDGSNKRSDAYGGSFENRARFLSEILTAVSAAIGADRVGVRLSPLNSYNGMIDSDPIALIDYLSKHLNSFNLAYLHLMRADFFQAQKGDVMTVARANYKGVLIGNMGYSGDEAQQAIKDGLLDVVAFGTGFLANPDLPARLKAGAALNAPDASTFYTPGEKGYTDYPTM
ncbi:alkene reductase [Undibacterium sp. LX40W]|uniref:Alkene reductase n=1 Tax=Undibacterium nitidum TaxID=2762298 RepID=A0A923HSA8_9BURK|nr:MULTISPECIES: alkene reductase [Undibacterium]MBC3883176.1 alkene reductase [Undibacterium nitidum]MBC3893458.1 alkene reductase [Undibacterium sp. LX40W]